MDRRVFLSSLTVGAVAIARIAPAQPARRLARIGVITVGYSTADMVGPAPKSATVNALVRGLEDLGYVYGEHYVTEVRGGETSAEHFPRVAAEMARLRLDVIVAPGPMLAALKQATSTVPIIMAGALDPVAQGLVKSLGQPGGNFTGFSLQSAEAVAKRLELLRDVVPTPTLVAVVWERTVREHWQVAETAARERGWQLLPIEVRDRGDIEGAFQTATNARAGGVLMLAGGNLYPQTQRLAELAIKNRLPAMYSLRPQVEAGGLMCYGPDIVDTWRRAAVFVDKIIKGAQPAKLPVEQPTKFEFVVNLKAARAIGLTIPEGVLRRADEVLQ